MSANISSIDAAQTAALSTIRSVKTGMLQLMYATSDYQSGVVLSMRGGGGRPVINRDEELRLARKLDKDVRVIFDGVRSHYTELASTLTRDLVDAIIGADPSAYPVEYFNRKHITYHHVVLHAAFELERGLLNENPGPQWVYRNNSTAPKHELNADEIYAFFHAAEDYIFDAIGETDFQQLEVWISVEASKSVAYLRKKGKETNNDESPRLEIKGDSAAPSTTGNPGAEAQKMRGLRNEQKMITGAIWAIKNHTDECMTNGKLSAAAILRLLEQHPYKVTPGSDDLPLNGTRAERLLSGWLKGKMPDHPAVPPSVKTSVN